MSPDEKRHKRFFYTFRPLVDLFCRLRFNSRAEKRTDIDGPFLVISNHVTFYDMFFVVQHFKPHMYFVASEHSMRAGVLSKLLRYFLDPIVRPKATIGASTVIKMKKRLKAGHNVCLFAEGEQNACGVNRKILKATAPVVKMMGVKLVTFRIHGAFFSSPRWSRTDRKGKIWCEIVNIYSPDELRAMSDDELDERINADIFVDAYADNAERHIAYKGKSLAEGIELELVKCPKCGRLNSVKSKGNKFFCECGLNGQYDEYGMLSGEGFDFKTITEWDIWEKHEIENMNIPDGDAPICRDPDQLLLEIRKDHTDEIVDSGELTLSSNALSVGNTKIELGDISRYDLIGRGRLLLTTKKGKYYQIGNKKHAFSGFLYILLMNRLLQVKEADC